MDVVRYAEKFESLDASVSYTFPVDEYTYQADQRYRQVLAAAAGADYAHDFAGYSPWAKEVADERITGIIWGASGADADNQFDSMASKLRSVGLGKLFIKDQAGARRWCYSKVSARPGYGTTATAFYNIPFQIEVVRLSDWFSTSLTSATASVSTNYHALTITNSGNAPVKSGLVMTLTATAAGGFSNVLITNVTTGEVIRWNGYARWSGAVLRIDTSDLSVKLLPDPGLVVGSSTSYVGEAGIGGPGVYVDSYPLISLGPTQGGLMTLQPGDNSVVVQVDGSASFDFYYEFYGAWE